MTYNVQNLFDTKDDPNTQDETFLPLSKKKSAAHKKKCKSSSTGSRAWECLFLDWTPQRLDKKMQNLAKQIFEAPGSKGPDVLILAEVENRAIVEEFNNKYLAKAGYTVYHMDSHDPRGIDQAVLSRLPFFEQKYHYIAFGKNSAPNDPLTELRGILHLVFQIDGLKPKIHVLALHLPSQAAPFVERAIVINEMNKAAMLLPKEDIVVAGGDFNISQTEWNSQKVLSSFLDKTWALAHLEGCKSCQGTYSFHKEWSFFDMLMLRKDLEGKNKWHWDKDSVQVLNVEHSDYPRSFDPLLGKGMSDHFPLFSTLVIE